MSTEQQKELFIVKRVDDEGGEWCDAQGDGGFSVYTTIAEAQDALDRKNEEGKGADGQGSHGGNMQRSGKFVTTEELDIVKTAQSVSGMFLSGGMPMGDPQREVEFLRQKYEMPDGFGLDISNGEFVSP